jgi:HEAT repeat protein
MGFNIQTLLEDIASGDEGRAQRAIQAMAGRPIDSLPYLERLLASENEDARWWAVAALSYFPPEMAGHHLVEALEDPAVPVNQCALIGLQQQPHVEALPGLVRLAGDLNALTARLAGGALARLGEEAIPALGEVMKGDNARARIQAARALAEMQVEATIPILFEALQDPLSMVVYWAEEGLERLGVGMSFFNPE